MFVHCVFVSPNVQCMVLLYAKAHLAAGKGSKVICETNHKIGRTCGFSGGKNTPCSLSLSLSFSLLPHAVSASRFLFPSGRTEIYLSLCTDASSALRYLVKTGTRSIQNIEGWKLPTFPGTPLPNTPTSRTTVK